MTTLETRTARIGLIGAGGIGKAHAEAASGLGALGALTAVADIDPDVAATVASSVAADVVPAAEMADPARFDLVVVASPPASHGPVVEPLLRAGVPVLCEKPLAVDLPAARALAAVAAQTGTPLAMATKFRFVDEVRETRALVASGALGRIVKVEVAFAGRVAMADRWNARPEIAGGGVLIDNATHGVDLAQFLLGAPITTVSTAEGPAAQALPVEDSAILLGRTADGTLAQVDVTWTFRRLSPVYCAVYGTDGTVEITWAGARRLVDPDPAPTAFGTGYNKIDSLRANLIGALAGQAATAEEALGVTAVIDAAYRSARTGVWTDVTP